MKRLVLWFSLVLLHAMPGFLRAQTTYMWSSSSRGEWTADTCWTPHRSSPAADDILIIKSPAFITKVPTQNIGNLTIGTNCTVVLNAASSATLTAGNGEADVQIGAGAVLTLGPGMTLVSTCEFVIDGTIRGSGRLVLEQYIGSSGPLEMSRFQLPVVFAGDSTDIWRSSNSATNGKSVSADGLSALRGTFRVINPRLRISDVSPSRLLRGITTKVEITGNGFFVGGSTVDLGKGIKLDSVNVLSPTRLEARATVSSSASTGPRTVFVTSPTREGGTAVRSNAITVGNPIPQVSGVIPDNVARGESSALVISGRDFIPGVTTVDVGSGIALSSVDVTNHGEIKAIITVDPEASVGLRNIRVVNPPPGGGTAPVTKALLVRNPLPTVSNISPPKAMIGQTLTVTVTGTGFLSAATSINFGHHIDVGAVSIANPTQLVVTIAVSPKAVAGVRDVEIINASPGGGKSVLSGAFVVANPVPTVERLAPTMLVRGGKVEVVISGTEFLSGVTSASFGPDIAVSSLFVRNSKEIHANLLAGNNAATGVRDVSVTNAPPGGGTATLPNVFTVVNPAPTLTSLIPTSAGRGSVVNLFLTGSQFLSGVTTSSFGPDITVSNINIKSSTEMVVSISISPSAALGGRGVSVTNASPGGGTSTLPTGFTVTTSPATWVEGNLGLVPDEYVLNEAYPNPFNPSTRIRYGIPENSRVELVVHNMLGNVVALLIMGERSKGLYELQWHADNLPSGVYLIRLQAQSLESTKRFLASRKVVLVK